MRLAIRSWLVVLVGVGMVAVGRAETPAGGSYQQWRAHRQRVLADPGVERYYTFEHDSDAPLANLAGSAGTLSRHVAKGTADEQLAWVEGRWPEKRAVRLDRDFLAAEPPIVLNASFTVAAWYRTHGMGAIAGDSVASGGTLLSVGTGYWDGWRLTLHYPEKVLGFELGRPQPSSSVGIHGGPAADGAWHHLAAAWDGRQMRLYLDGCLLAAGPFAEPYTLPSPGAALRIGFAGAGWGSAVLDVDEGTVYRRALGAVDVLRLAHFYAPLDEPAAARFADADRLVEAKDDAAALDQYDGLACLEDLPVDYRAVARLERARIHQKQHNRPAALAELARVAEMTGVAESHLGTALGGLLQSISLEGAAPGSKILEKILARPELSPREQYAKVLADPDAPAHYKSQAQLQIAASYAREKRWPAARLEYAKLTTLSATPEHHRWEAQECLRELARTEAGLSPRDPAASRTVLPARPKPAVQFYVSPDGSDANPGTIERPVASLERARDLLRESKARLGQRRGAATVWLRGGEYARREPFRLTAEDSGTAAAPVIYRAYPGESARLYAGARLAGLVPVADPAVLARLPEPARGKVLEVDLRAAGITDYNRVIPSVGHGPQPVLELFCNRKPLTLARWPNAGFVNVEKVIQQGSAAEKRGFVFQYEGDRPRNWPAKDLWLYGYFQHLWADATLGVAALDPQARQITAAATSPWEVRQGYPYYAFNLLEELDVPGEWYLDRSAGLLYVYPPVDPAQAVFEMSVLAAPLVEINGVSHVTIRQLTLELGQTDGLVIRGGDRKTLAPGGHFVENCHVHDFSRVHRTYTPAVQLDGVGNRIAHNLFHDSPGHAMRIEGNDHTIELNEIHHVVLETDDQGGLDMWFNPTYRGNVIRWNYWHDIANGRPCGQAGVRLDDAISDTLIYGNVFARCAEGHFGGVQIHGGKENLVDNNVFIDCRQAISFSSWGAARWKAFLETDRVIEATTKTVDIRRPPYANRYLRLAHLAENPDVNLIWRNLAFRCGEFLVRDRGIQDLRGNLITDQDPGVTESAGRRLPWQPDPSLLDRIGFRPIPLDEIGLYADELRPGAPRNVEAAGD